MLCSSPDIIPNIHELDITEGALFGVPAGVNSTTWVATERTLPHLLKMLTHLQRLEFGAHTTLYWVTLPIGLQNAICHVFTLPSLTYVRLKSWSFPTFAVLADLLSHCQNLKGLALSSTMVGDDGKVRYTSKLTSGCAHRAPGVEGGDVDSTRRCSLEFLTIDYMNFRSLAHWLFSQGSTIEIKGLRELRVAHFPDVTAIEQLLAVTGSSLEHFHLKPGPWDVHSFDLSRNSGLRSIRLTLEDPLSAIAWVQTLLSSLSPTNILERLGIEFYADLKKMDGWAELDSVLAELGSLREVEIGLFAPPSHSEVVRVKEELSGLAGRGVLRIYQLGTRNQRPNSQLTPRISRYECHL